MKIAKARVMQAYNAVGEHFGNHQSMGKNVYSAIACHCSETSQKAVYGTALKTSLQLVRSLVG